MTYELALKLKEAGFPQNTENVDNFIYNDNYDEEGGCYLPTLDELIDACGGVLLWGCKTHGYFASKQFCPVENKTLDSVIEADAEGSTHSEAVANLWLELNKVEDK